MFLQCRYLQLAIYKNFSFRVIFVHTCIALDSPFSWLGIHPKEIQVKQVKKYDIPMPLTMFKYYTVQLANFKFIVLVRDPFGQLLYIQLCFGERKIAFIHKTFILIKMQVHSVVKTSQSIKKVKKSQFNKMFFQSNQLASQLQLSCGRPDKNHQHIIVVQYPQPVDGMSIIFKGMYSLVVSNLHLETKGSRFNSGCQ